MTVSFLFRSGRPYNNSYLSFMIYGFSLLFFPLKSKHCYLPYCVKSSRSAQELAEKTSALTAYDQACFLTVATFKTIYEGFFKRRSVTNTANFFHSGGDWGKQRKTERGRGGEEVNVKEEDREGAVNSINLCILIHILATSLISVSPAPF